MDLQNELSVSQVALYALLSFILVSLLGVLIYITCSKKYKLNWFENNLLETAKETERLDQSHEVLVNCGASYNAESSVAGSSRSLNRITGSPTSVVTDDPTFWVPPPGAHSHRQASISQSEQQHSGIHKMLWTESAN